MDYVDLARQAKIQADYRQAHHYLQEKMKAGGITSELLQRISEVFYLQGENYFALTFRLAAVHLHLYYAKQRYQADDADVRIALAGIPSNLAEQFPDPIGALLLKEMETFVHLGHCYADQTSVYKEKRAFEDYASIYHAYLLEDDSLEEVLADVRLTQKEFEQIQEKEYIPLGMTVVLSQLQWDQLDNPDVPALYFT